MDRHLFLLVSRGNNCLLIIFMIEQLLNDVIYSKVYIPQVYVTLTDFGFPSKALWFICSQRCFLFIWLVQSFHYEPVERYSTIESCVVNYIYTFLLHYIFYGFIWNLWYHKRENYYELRRFLRVPFKPE